MADRGLFVTRYSRVAGSHQLLASHSLAEIYRAREAGMIPAAMWHGTLHLATAVALSEDGTGVIRYAWALTDGDGLDGDVDSAVICTIEHGDTSDGRRCVYAEERLVKEET